MVPTVQGGLPPYFRVFLGTKSPIISYSRFYTSMIHLKICVAYCANDRFLGGVDTSIVIGDIFQVTLVRALGYGAPYLPGAVLVGLVVDLGLQDDVLENVADRLAALGLAGFAGPFGIVVPRDALHAGDADDGLLERPRAARGARDEGDAPFGQARVVPGLFVADELPDGAHAGRAGVDDTSERSVQLGLADGAQGLAVAGC